MPTHSPTHHLHIPALPLIQATMRCLLTSILSLAGLAAVVANQPQRKYTSMSQRGRFSCCLGDVIFIHSFIHSYIHTHPHTHIHIQSPTHSSPSPTTICFYRCVCVHSQTRAAIASLTLPTLSPTSFLICLLLQWPGTSQCPSTRPPPPIGPHSAPRYVRLCVCMCRCMRVFL